MKMGILKSRYVILGIFAVMQSCSIKKDLTYDEFAILNSTHRIENRKVAKHINEYINENSDFKDYNSDTGVIFVNEYDKETYSICLAFVNYKKLKRYRNKDYEKLKGYIKINGTQFILFGDIEAFFERNKGVSIQKGILGKTPVFNKDNPPIIFEPNYECVTFGNYEINNKSYNTFNPFSNTSRRGF